LPAGVRLADRSGPCRAPARQALATARRSAAFPGDVRSLPKGAGRMEPLMVVLIVTLDSLLGLALGYVAARLLDRVRLNGLRQQTERLTLAARDEAEKIKKEAELKAKDELFQRREELEKEMERQRGELREQERRLDKREDSLEEKNQALVKKERVL